MIQNPPRSSGRLLVALGIALCVLGIPLGILQFSQGLLFVPWYIPALSLVGALLVLVAFLRSRSIVIGIVLILTLAFAGLEGFFLGVGLKTPDYSGPANVGSSMPAFTTAYADGRPFTDKDLADGRTTVLTFFRGRW
jgi:FtsH-binding integral membrane protein